KDRFERVYKALEFDINRTFPESHVQLKLLGAAVLVMGHARDHREAVQILHVVVANTPWAGRSPGDGIAPVPHYLGSGSPHVINMLQVPSAQQVTLKIAVTEMSR